MLLGGADGVVSPLSIRLFGSFELWLHGSPRAHLCPRKGRWLLALLVLRSGHSCERDELARRLWPESEELDAAQHALRQTLPRVRDALGSEADRLLNTPGRHLCLDLTGAEVDLLAFDQAIARDDPASLEQAVELYRGPLLEGCPEKLFGKDREARKRAYLKALMVLAADGLSHGDRAAASRCLRLAVTEDPREERPQRALMQSLVDSGLPEDALWVYHEFCHLIRGADPQAAPGRETRLLFEQIRAEARRPVREPMQAVASSPSAPALSKETQPDTPSLILDSVTQPSAALRVVLLVRGAAQPDQQVAALLETELTAHGFQVFVDQQAGGGLEWAREVERQVRSADVVVSVLSSASVHSELLQDELQLAREVAHQQNGKPQLVPVQVRDPGPLPDPLAAILGPCQRIVWEGPQDDERATAELIQALRSAPAPPRDLPPPGGAVPLDSRYYVVRPTDCVFHAAIAGGESVVLVRGARQTGKTSLPARGLQQARESGCRVVRTDLQVLDPADLGSAEAFFQAVGGSIAEQLDLDVFPRQVRNPQLGGSVNFARFLRRQVLPVVEGRLVWGLDEVDRLFTHEFSSQVFGLFRSWHNDRVLDPTGPWSRLTLAIAYATEVYLFIQEVDQSPFNVGTRVTLDDFTLAQVSDLNERYGAPLRAPAEVERFYDLLGGHPYLVSRGLREMVARELTLAELEATAPCDGGLFGDHLRRMIVVLARNPELCEVVRGVLRGEPCPSEASYYQLWSAGIVTGESSHEVRPRCPLYAAYLKRHLL